MYLFSFRLIMVFLLERSGMIPVSLCLQLVYTNFCMTVKLRALPVTYHMYLTPSSVWWAASSG